MSIPLNNNWQPFNIISNSELYDLIFLDTDLHENYNIDNLNLMKFSQFTAAIDNPLENSDPDTNYFDNASSYISNNDVCNQCKYYFVDDLNKNNLSNNFFSICSLNINSLPKNFSS